jgi:hypothetical protein
MQHNVRNRSVSRMLLEKKQRGANETTVVQRHIGPPSAVLLDRAESDLEAADAELNLGLQGAREATPEWAICARLRHA